MMTPAQEAYRKKELSRVDQNLARNWAIPWFVRNLIPAPGVRERSAFSMGKKKLTDPWVGEGSPLITVAARQFTATRGALAGAPQQVAVSRNTPDAVASWIGVLLQGLDPSERRTAIYSGLSKASGPAMSVVPFAEAIPKGATPDQARALVNGLGSLLLSLGAAAATDSASTIAARASSMALRQPFAADPRSPASPSDVSLAKMLLDAYLADEGLRDEIFKSEPFRQALEAVTAEAAGDTVAGLQAEADQGAEGMSPTEIDLQRRIYDCIRHELPLGGDPLEGGKLGDWLKKTAGKVRNFFRSVDSAEAETYFKERSTYWRDYLSKQDPNKSVAAIDSEAREKAIAETRDKFGSGWSPNAETASGAQTESSDLGGTGGTSGVTTSDDITEELASSVSDSKKLLDEALASIASTRGTLATQQAKLKSDALDYAKLIWASEILSATDDVAEILANVKPNTSDPGAFISSALSVLPAAKASGNLSTLKAMANAVRAAATQAGATEGSVLSMLMGDPIESTPEPVISPSQLAGALRSVISQSWGSAAAEALSEASSQDDSALLEASPTDEIAEIARDGESEIILPPADASPVDAAAAEGTDVQVDLP